MLQPTEIKTIEKTERKATPFWIFAYSLIFYVLNFPIMIVGTLLLVLRKIGLMKESD